MQKIKKGNVKEITIALAIFVCAMVIIGGITLYAAETNTTADGNYEYTVLNDGTVEITKYVGTETEVTIPAIIDGKFVTSIGRYAFSGCKSLTSVVIPDGVTNIGNNAFSSCRSLTSIKISASVTSIGQEVFYYCSSLTSIEVASNNQNYISIDGVLYNKEKTKLIKYPEGKNNTEYIIPEGVTNIGSNSFYCCNNLISIKIPKGVTNINFFTFGKCTSLTTIEIPDTVTSIDSSAFIGCNSLASIEIDSNNQMYSSIDGVLYNKEKTKLIKYPEGKNNTEYIIPEGVTNIGSWAFDNCISLTTIKIPESVTNIENLAFSGCSSLTSIEIPKGVTKIESQVFFECSSLTSIEIPEGVTSIGVNAFEGCSSLTSIEIPDTVTNIGGCAFFDCDSLTSIEIPAGVTSVGGDAFYCCSNLTRIEVDSNNQNYISIDGVLFNKNKTKLIKYPSKKTDIEYIIPDEVTSIGGYAFEGCSSLTSIEIPDAVTTIEEMAFYYSRSLTNIKIPDGVTSIGDRVFDNNIKIYCRSNSYAKEYAISKNLTYEIDDVAPSVISVTGNPTNWINKSVTLTINGAKDTGVGLANRPYSFDGGETWQEENTKLYEENTKLYEENANGIVINVKDALGNIYTCGKIIITKIDKQAPRIESVTANTENWTNQNVTLTINGAKDEHSGLADMPYSFDGGETWQEENIKEYNENTEGIVIKVRDTAGNTYLHDMINITNDHIEVISARIEATCTETGLTEGKECLVCNEVLVAQEIVPATGHTEEIDPAVEATCTEEGLTEGSHCSVCENVLVAQEIVPATGHTEEIDPAVEATCTEEGLTEGSHCSVCGDVLEAQQPILAIGHNYESGECTNCGEKAPEITVESGKYNVEEGMLTKISPETTIEAFIQEIETNATKVEIYSANNELVEEGEKIATGMKIKLELYGQEKEYILAVLGDTNGDGKADFRDILQINKHRLNKAPLQGEYLKAGDVTEDGGVDFSDILKVNKYRLGKINSL